MFKEYISNTIRHVHWTIHAQSSFLIPYLEKISVWGFGQVKETTDDTLLTVIRKDRYKILGEFEADHANKIQTYLVKIYKYPDLIQKVEQLFKNTRGFREFNTTYISAMKGIPVEVTVAYGEGRRLFTEKSYLIITDVHPKVKNKKAMKALILLAFSLIGKFFSRDYPYVPAWQCRR